MNNTEQNPIEAAKKLNATPELTGPKIKFPKFTMPVKVKLNKKVTLTVFGVLLVATATYFGKGFFVVALVNGEPISRLEILQELERRNGAQILDGVVNQKLIDQEAAARGITVSQSDLDSAAKQIEENMKAQGLTLDQALAQQNLSQREFYNILKTNKQLELLTADKVGVTEEELAKYMEDNKESFPTDGDLEALKVQVRNFLQQQKVETESQKLFSELRAKAKIQNWVQY